MNLIKKIVAILTVLTVFSMVGSPVLAVTAEELQAQITALLAQLTALQAQLATLQGTTPTVTGCTITSFAQNLKQGMTGDDVKCLQIILNSATDTQVATEGAGSPGNETTYFGSLTKAAVIKFQEKYASEILATYGLTTGTGFVGTTTRAKLNTLIGVTPPPTGCTTDADCAAGYMCSAGTCVLKPVTGTGLTVALATDTPASGTVVDLQGLAPLAKFTFTNGDSAEVKVTQLKLKRMGVSADASLTNVYLFDGAVRLTDAASVSSGVITFSDSTGVFKVAAGSSKTIIVLSDIDGTSGETLGVAINAASDITSTASAINGTFPISGNLMTIATATLAGVNFAAVTPSATDVSPQNDYTVWQSITTITTRAVTLSRFSLRKLGSVKNTDLQNFRFYVDGVQQGSAVQNLDDNGYVTFDLTASPLRLESGARTLKVVADIIGGSSLNFWFKMNNSADATFTDTQYGVTIKPATGGATTFTVSDVTTGTQSVSSGTLTVEKTSDSPSGNIVNNAANAILAKFKLTAAGEKVKIETLYVSAIVNTAGVSGLRNGALYANGVQVGSTTTLYDPDDSSYDYTTFNLGSSLIVEPGSPVTLEVRADIYDTGTSDTTNSIVAGSTITARIEDIGGSTGNNNATGMVSSTTIDVPSADVDGNQTTVAAGSLTLAKYTAYTNQTMIDPVTAAKLAHFTLTAATTENVNLSTINVDFDTVTGDFDASSDLTNMYLTYGANTSTVKPTVADTGNSWSINYVLPAGNTIDVILYANVGSSAYVSATSYGIASLTITGTTTSSATSVTSGEVTGQTITFSTGTFAAVKDGASPIAQAVAGAQQITSAKFKFTAVSDAYTIKELKFSVGSATISAGILNAILKDGSTVLATKPFDTSGNTVAYFTGLNVIVPANSNKTLDVVLDLSTPSADYSTSQINVATTLAWMKYATSQGVETEDDNPSDTTATTGGTDPVGSAIYVYKTIPTFTVQSLPSTSLTTGTSQVLYKFTVAANAKGPVSIKQLKFNVVITDGSGAGTEILDTFKFLRGSDDITTSVAILDASEDDIESSTDYVGEGSNTVIVTFATEETIAAGSSVTYSLKATSTAMASSTTGKDSVSSSLLGDASGHNGTSVYLNLDGNTTINGLYTSAAASTTSATAYNVIWSDNSAIGHSSTTGTASSGDWANGYLILDLPLDSMSLIVP